MSDIPAVLVAELRKTAASLRHKALVEQELAFPLETQASRAKRNRRKSFYLDLAVEYERLAEGYLKARKIFQDDGDYLERA